MIIFYISPKVLWQSRWEFQSYRPRLLDGNANSREVTALLFLCDKDLSGSCESLFLNLCILSPHLLLLQPLSRPPIPSHQVPPYKGVSARFRPSVLSQSTPIGLDRVGRRKIHRVLSGETKGGCLPEATDVSLWEQGKRRMSIISCFPLGNLCVGRWRFGARVHARRQRERGGGEQLRWALRRHALPPAGGGPPCAQRGEAEEELPAISWRSTPTCFEHVWPPHTCV